jgi:tripeptidyl-peptidase-1
LYAHPDAFFDVTKGSNPGCGTNGFNAAAGWDPVTGLGTPNYPALLDAFMKQ